MARPLLALALLLHWPAASGKTCLSIRSGTQPGCSSKCKAEKAHRHCHGLSFFFAAAATDANGSSTSTSTGTGLPSTPPLRRTSVVLQKIGYIPGEQLPLEFGGMASDFTASGSASTMLLRAEEATARQQQQQQQQQHDTERPTQRARLKRRAAKVDASVAEAPPLFGEGEKLMLKRSRRRNKRRTKSIVLKPSQQPECVAGRCREAHNANDQDYAVINSRIA